MQAPADDAWGHWFPFVQHNPVLGDKKSWRDRAELLRRLERDGIIVAKGKMTVEEKGRAASGGLERRANERWEHRHLLLSNARLFYRHPGRAGVRRAGRGHGWLAEAARDRLQRQQDLGQVRRQEPAHEQDHPGHDEHGTRLLLQVRSFFCLVFLLQRRWDIYAPACRG